MAKAGLKTLARWQRFRELHALNMCDSDIARAMGISRCAAVGIRWRLGLRCNLRHPRAFAVQAPLPPAKQPKAGPEANQCRYIEDQPEPAFCVSDRLPGRPYCADHQKRCTRQPEAAAP